MKPAGVVGVFVVSLTVTCNRIRSLACELLGYVGVGFAVTPEPVPAETKITCLAKVAVIVPCPVIVAVVGLAVSGLGIDIEPEALQAENL